MDDINRLAAFEKMLLAIENDYNGIEEKMKLLKSQGKEKSATYRQLMGNKLQYQNMLSLYEVYGLLNKEDE